MKPELLITELNKIEQNWIQILSAIVYYCDIMLTTVGNSARL
jgi:hypothetical protein